MNRRTGSRAAKALRKDWRRWMGVIEVFARGRGAKLQTNPVEYQTLYEKLVKNTSELAQVNDGDQRSVFEFIEATVRPWMSPRVLEQADREILLHLVERCRRIDRILQGRSRVSWPDAAPVLLFIAGSAVSLFLLTIALRRWSALASVTRAATSALWSSLGRLSHVEQLFTVGLLVVVVSIYNVSRTARH